jgi:hypothetical protein
MEADPVPYRLDLRPNHQQLRDLRFMIEQQARAMASPRTPKVGNVKRESAAPHHNSRDGSPADCICCKCLLLVQSGEALQQLSPLHF